MMRRLIFCSFLVLGLSFSLPRVVEANDGEFTWQPWRQRGDYPVRFDSGFSNLELGGYMEFEAYCNAQGATEFWYRLSDFVLQLEVSVHDIQIVGGLEDGTERFEVGTCFFRIYPT